LPTTVPIAEAMILPRIVSALSMARTKWKPMKGVKETAAPQAKPAAMR
jgi:hypothetical protein